MNPEITTNAVAAAHSLGEFLGASLEKVDQLVLHMAFVERPDWLRGKYRYGHLPRVDQIPSEGWSFIPIGALSKRELALRVLWIIDTLNDSWNISEHGFGFENETEAMLFRLKWA